jgi:phosphoribosylanthranilate isomerase
MTRVKICGVTEAAHALAAAEAGADFIGLVFAPSKRQVDAGRALEIVQAVKGLERPPQTVGVFVNLPAIEVERTAERCGLDRVQLSGDEPWDYIRDIALPVIKAIRVKAGQSGRDVLAELTRGERFMDEGFVCLLDCDVAGSYGGSGRAFDWAVAKEATQRYPVIIAGGLSPNNVGQAIRLAAPWGVDVSSGVESRGKKNVEKIKAFIDAVRAADEK